MIAKKVVISMVGMMVARIHQNAKIIIDTNSMTEGAYP